MIPILLGLVTELGAAGYAITGRNYDSHCERQLVRGGR